MADAMDARRGIGWKTVLLEFEGATRDSGLKKGWYIDQDTGERVHDQSYCYTVALTRRRVERLPAMLGEACWVFGQKCIYLSVAGHVEFVEKSSDESR
jgi:hypothetical protein